MVIKIYKREKSMKSRIKTISEMANVSATTVSNVLNGKGGASEETTQKILKIAKELGYRKAAPTTQAAIDTIAFVMYKKHGQVLTDTPFFASLLEGIERESRKNNCNLQIYHVNGGDGDSYQSTIKEIAASPKTGLLVMATEMDEADAVFFEGLVAPLVMVDGWLEGFDFNSVLINNSSAAYKAVQYLIEQGHKEIGYLRSTCVINNFYYRFTGFRRAMERYGLPLREEYNTFAVSPTMDGAYKDMLQILEKNPKLPTAFFADNDIIAIGAMKAMAEKGLRIPENVSIIGMDDMPYCEIVSPSLTTMRVDKESMGELAVKRLMDISGIQDPVPVKIQINTKLILRQSVKNMNK